MKKPILLAMLIVFDIIPIMSTIEPFLPKHIPDFMDYLPPEDASVYKTYNSLASRAIRIQERYEEYASKAINEQKEDWPDFLNNWNISTSEHVMAGFDLQTKITKLEAARKALEPIVCPSGTPPQAQKILDRCKKMILQDGENIKAFYDSTKPIGSTKSRIPILKIASLNSPDEDDLSPRAYAELDTIFANLDNFGSNEEQKTMVNFVVNSVPWQSFVLDEESHQQFTAAQANLAKYLRGKWQALQNGDTRLLEKVSPTTNKTLAFSLIQLFYADYAFLPETFNEVIHVLLPGDENTALLSQISQVYTERFSSAIENGYLNPTHIQKAAPIIRRDTPKTPPTPILPAAPGRAQRMADYKPVPQQSGRKDKQPTPTVGSQEIPIVFALKDTFDFSNFGSPYQAELIARLEKLSYEKVEEIAMDPSGLFETDIFGSHLQFIVENNEITSIIIAGAWPKKMISQPPSQS